jgi:hypothetical protein
MSQSHNPKQKPENMPLKRSKLISVYARNVSEMAEIITVETKNVYFYLSKYLNLFSFRQTSYTLHVHVPVVGIWKWRISYHVHFNTLINSMFSRRSNKRGQILKTTGIYIYILPVKFFLIFKSFFLQRTELLYTPG